MTLAGWTCLTAAAALALQVFFGLMLLERHLQSNLLIRDLQEAFLTVKSKLDYQTGLLKNAEEARLMARSSQVSSGGDGWGRQQLSTAALDGLLKEVKKLERTVTDSLTTDKRRAAAISTQLFRTTVVQAERMRMLLLVPRNDEFVQQSMMRGVVVDSEVLATLLRYVRPGSTVVDVGANVGDFTAFFARAAGPSGSVVAFEPQTLMFQLMCANLMLNDITNVRTLHAAAGHKAGEARLAATVPDGEGQGLNYARAVAAGELINFGGMPLGAGGERVALVTIDSLNLTDVSVLKVDVEGAEPLVMWGARALIRAQMPVIAFEQNYKRLTQDMVRSMAVPKEVAGFQFIPWAQKLGYTLANVGASNYGNYILYPPAPRHGRLRRPQRPDADDEDQQEPWWKSNDPLAAPVKRGTGDSRGAQGMEGQRGAGRSDSQQGQPQLNAVQRESGNSGDLQRSEGVRAQHDAQRQPEVDVFRRRDRAGDVLEADVQEAAGGVDDGGGGETGAALRPRQRLPRRGAAGSAQQAAGSQVASAGQGGPVRPHAAQGKRQGGAGTDERAQREGQHAGQAAAQRMRDVPADKAHSGQALDAAAGGKAEKERGEELLVGAQQASRDARAQQLPARGAVQRADQAGREERVAQLGAAGGTSQQQEDGWGGDAAAQDLEQEGADPLLDGVDELGDLDPEE